MPGSTVTAFESGMAKAVDFKRGLSCQKAGFSRIYNFLRLKISPLSNYDQKQLKLKGGDNLFNRFHHFNKADVLNLKCGLQSFPPV